MCGIAGFVFAPSEAPEPRLDRMLSSMQARGPDGEGRLIENGLALGMRRLAIRDLEHGQQPFTSHDQQIVAFVNGEIYNYAALRRELEGHGIRFETSCDSELLPHAFRVFGPEQFPHRLDGMFAIAILDRGEQALHLYRDRYGEKPVFYSHLGDSFRFASQLSTLVREPEFDFEIDRTSLRQYLSVHYVPGGRTMVRGICKLPPGHRLSLDLSTRKPGRVARWAEAHERTTRVPLGYAAATRRVRSLLTDSVVSRMAADVPVGVFLSGGLDSSAVAAIAQKHTGLVETFSVGFQDAKLDESRHARAVATALGTRHHHFDFDLEACLSVFEDTIAALDEPVGDPACLPVYLLARESATRVKVVLTGEGADEIFAGYDYYPIGSERTSRFPSLSRLLARRREQRATASPGPFFRSDHTTASGFPMLTSKGDRDDVVPQPGSEAPSDEDAWTSGLMTELAGIDCELRRAQQADLRSWLPDDLLVKLDRMTMAASIEGRAPYLEPDLVALGLAMPAEWKQAGGNRKRVLRDAVRPLLPLEIVDRRKQGFVLPMQEWLLGPLRERLLDGLGSGPADGLDLASTRRIVEEDLGRGASRSRLLYGLLAFREWAACVREARARTRRLDSSRVPGERFVHGSGPP